MLFCHTLGKAQRILPALAERTDRRVLLHGAMTTMTGVYRRAGVRMLATEGLVERTCQTAAGERDTTSPRAKQTRSRRCE